MKIKYVQLDSSAFFTDLDFIAMTLEERGTPVRHRNISGISIKTADTCEQKSEFLKFFLFIST